MFNFLFCLFLILFLFMKKMLVFQRMMWQEYFVAVAVVAAAAVAVSEVRNIWFFPLLFPSK